MEDVDGILKIQLASWSGQVGSEIWRVGSGRVTENGPVDISEIFLCTR